MINSRRYKIAIFFIGFVCLWKYVLADEKHIQQAMLAPLAGESLLLDADIKYDLIVIVGERGHILYTNDSTNWTQALVNSRATLTSVYLLDNKTGWAAGHDAVIVRTRDGGKTWQKVFSAIDEEAPFLDILFKDALNGIAVGAYGLYYITKDGGSSWQKSELILNEGAVKDENDAEAFNDIYDLHLNSISKASDQRYYIAAEAGYLFRSDDGAKTWINLPSPYHGSFFGIHVISENELFAYGLRGNLYRSLDAGESWEKIETNTNELLTDIVQLTNDNIIVSGMGGTLLISEDRGGSFKNITMLNRQDLSSILEKNNGDILLTSDSGYHILKNSNFNPQF